jgi:hypothetical protein
MLTSYDLVDVLYYNFCNPLRINTASYMPLHDTKIENLSWQLGEGHDYAVGPCYFLFEEPLNQKDLNDLAATVEWGMFNFNKNNNRTVGESYLQILANSEKSQLKSQWLKKNQVLDWYFFYHGFAALFWFKTFKYLPKNKPKCFANVFITYNHIINFNRSYRLTFISKLVNLHLDKFGLIGAPLVADKKLILDEITDANSRISTESKLLIYNTLLKNDKKFILDFENPYGQLSANINLNLNQTAFCQIVTETVFYDNALHLTEKIFKPIICRQPFLLLGAPGNLKYLKSYGFKTFDKWWDESYDDEIDADKRIDKVIDIINYLTKNNKDLPRIYDEMYQILDYNFNHFFSTFKKIIVEELVDNFETCLDTYNRDLHVTFQVDKTKISFDEIKTRLLS